MQRVQKLLSNYGYCSRRKAEDLIIDGRVRVNKSVISIGDKANSSDKIYVDNKLVNKERKVYLIFNKPINCVTALSDKHKKTIMHYIKLKERVFPVGRLDFNTSGLLLLTNDGDFSNKIMHPRYEINKTYLVKIDIPIKEDSVKKIEKGILLEDGKTSEAYVKIIKDNLLEITIHEGRNRIIRRMLNKLGFSVKSLERTKIGNLKLGNLSQGKFRELTKIDMDKIFS